MRGNEAPKLGGEKGGERVGGFSCAAVGEAICLEEPGYLPSPVPTFPPSDIPPPSSAQTSACLSQCPSEDISTGLMCNPVIFHWPEYAQILSRVCCVELGVCIPRKQT